MIASETGKQDRSPSTRDPSLVDWPLIGRASEVEWLRAWLVSAELRGAVLAGPAGVGKTRLARELERTARELGKATTWITATRSAAALPFGALAGLLPEFSGGRAGTLDNLTDLARRLASILVARAGNRDLLVVVDDAHLLDGGLATLIHQLVIGGAVSVLLTVRAGEVAPDPVVALWRDELAARLDIRGLGSKAIEDLLSAALGAPVDAAVTAKLAVRCQGNVMFLREMVLAALANQTLRESDGIWSLHGPLPVSDRLVELVEGRLAGLTDRERDILEVISYAEPLSSDELRIVDPTGAAPELERKGLLRCGPEERRVVIRLAHPIYGDVLRQRMPRLRAEALARRLADAFEEDAARPDDRLRVAVWRLEGGGGRADLLLEAAWVARWHHDFELAERLGEAAIAGGAGFEARLLAARLAGLRGRPEEAVAQLKSLSDDAATDDERGRVALALCDYLMYWTDRVEEGLRAAAAADAGISDPRWRDEIASRRVGGRFMTSGARVLDEALELSRRTTGSARVFALMVAGLSLTRLGRVEQLIEVTERAYSESLSSPTEWYPWIHLYLRCQGLAAAGRFAEAEELAREQYERGLESGSAEARAFFGWHLASAVGAQGHIEASALAARQSMALFRELGRENFARSVQVHLALALALGGRTGEAAHALQDTRWNAKPLLWMRPETLIAHAWIEVGSGDLGEGRGALREAVDVAGELGDLRSLATALHDLARLGEAREVQSELCAVAEQMDSSLARTQARHAQALHRRDPEQLLAIANSFAAMDADLLAAECAFDGAVTFEHFGDQRRAAAAQREARALASRCPDAVTPAMRSVASRAELTPSERETALLASRGHSNREIAELQHLSIRTVENRLQRVYLKLGTNDRSELANLV
jgi:DNA-binding CsgD family transcriptional regulator